jgi:hypothetical protein
MAKRTVFDQAIAAHGRWTYRLYQAIKTGESEWSVSEVRTDNRCDFGAWLEQLPDAAKASERCRRVRALHAAFHERAAEVLRLALSGKTDEAKAAIALGSDFSKTSADLTMALSEWSDSGLETE